MHHQQIVTSWICSAVQENYVNTMADDDLAPYVTRSSTAMILIVWEKHDLLFLEDKLS